MAKKFSKTLLQFAKKCIELGGITPEFACVKIYGQWSVQIDDQRSDTKFNKNNYESYDLEIREAIVKEILASEDSQRVLADICWGYFDDTNFRKELELWKTWGATKIIENAFKEILTFRASNSDWTNFVDAMDFAGVKLDHKEVAVLSNYLDENGDLSQDYRDEISACIKKHK